MHHRLSRRTNCGTAANWRGFIGEKWDDDKPVVRIINLARSEDCEQLGCQKLTYYIFDMPADKQVASSVY